MPTKNSPKKDAPPHFRARPWSGAARDEEANLWRKKHTPLINVVRSSMTDANPGLVGPGKGTNRYMAIAGSINIYEPEADPADRTALIDWLGAAAVVSDFQSKGNGRGIPHLVIARLMRSWATVVWYGSEKPDWAEKFLEETLGKSDHHTGLSKAIALGDLRTYLLAHQRMNMGAIATRPEQRNVHHKFSEETIGASIALILWAIEHQEKPLGPIIQDLVDFKACYGRAHRYENMDKKVTALWEIKTLADFTKSIPGSPEHEDAIKPVKMRVL
jgi:hypothetical protein